MRIIQGSVQHEKIMTLIDEAKRALILVSPYLSPWQRLTAAIERARVRGVAIFLILRGGEDRAKRGGSGTAATVLAVTAVHRAPARQGLS